MKQDNDTAVVEVSGPVEVKAAMSMVKQGNKWVLVEKEEAAKKAHEPAAAVSHQAAPKTGHEAASVSKQKESPASEHKAPEHKAPEHQAAAHKAG